MTRSFKRPFQPSTSSCFGHASHNTSAAPYQSSAPQTPILSPTLPATIQSSLLNVGMRVRKSVPEGYKTKSKVSHGSTQAFFNALSSNSQEAHRNLNDSSGSNATLGGFAGLMPYCGILKVGAHDVQPVPAEEDLPPLHFENDADAFSIPSSQESNASSTSIFTTTPTTLSLPLFPRPNKRRREDPDDENEDAGDLQPVSPRSYPVSHTRMPNLGQLRPIALPRTRKKGLGESGGGDGLRESEMIDAGDFGNAPFFRPEEWLSGWGEVEM